MNKLFLLLGKSCSGKDTVMSNLLPKLAQMDIDISKIPSCTTRPMRCGEVQNREYYFTTLKEFDELYKDKKIAEYSIYNTRQGFWCYFTKRSDIELLSITNLIGVKNPLGYRQLCSSGYKDRIVTILLDCPEYILKERYMKRGELDDDINDRMKRDFKDFYYLKPNYAVSNDGNRSIDEVAEEVLQIIKNEVK